MRRMPFLIVALALLSGCSTHERLPEAAGVANVCISECQRALQENRDLSHGPCLLESVPDNPGWVCDVAHSPHQPVDDLQENQCQSYGRPGGATHFVEVGPDCRQIREN